MSECVVRMEMPEGCADCPFMDIELCCCAKGRKYAGSSPVRPDWCPIICQLPEGHGDLVEAKEITVNVTIKGKTCSADVYAPTIVPAERSETCLD